MRPRVLSKLHRWTAFWAVVATGCAGAPGPVERSALRVGTTGTYAPFSTAAGNGYVGLDIDLARDLGRELGRPVVFVQTTYRNLIRDAIAHRFDLAMSAINITEDRTVSVDFSRPYHEYGRVAIVRCSERDRYRTFEDMNRPEVTVLVQESSTTAMYGLAHLPRAHVQQTDAVEWYERLLGGEVDVILETAYEYRRHPGLCTALGGATFYIAPIAVLFPKGSPLVDDVNAWLENRLADGTVRRLLDHYDAP